MPAPAVRLTRLDPAGADRQELLAFLTSEEFPFHVRRRISAADAASAVDSGAYRDDEHDTSWLDHDDHGRIGLVRLEDLADPVPCSTCAWPVGSGVGASGSPPCVR